MLSFPQITEYILRFPASAESLLWQAATIVLTMVIVRFGTVALAAHQLGLEAEGLSYMPSIGLGVACTTLVGQALGARDRELTKFYVREVLTWTILLTIVTGGILLLFPRFLLGLLTNDGEVILWFLDPNGFNPSSSASDSDFKVPSEVQRYQNTNVDRLIWNMGDQDSIGISVRRKFGDGGNWRLDRYYYRCVYSLFSFVILF